MARRYVQATASSEKRYVQNLPGARATFGRKRKRWGQSIFVFSFFPLTISIAPSKAGFDLEGNGDQGKQERNSADPTD